MLNPLKKMIGSVSQSMTFFSLLIAGVAVCINTFIISPLPANAVSFNSVQGLIGLETPDVLDQALDGIEGKVQKDIGTTQRKAGEFTGQTEGVLNQVQGKAQQDLGTVQRKASEITGQTETEGALNQAQGKAQKDIGTVQRKVGEITGQTEGALNQAQGKAQQDIGEVKNRLENASDSAEDAGDNLLDSVKSLFGQ